MKTFIITYIILITMSMHIKLSRNFAEITISKNTAIVVFIIEIAFLIWATSTLSH